MRHYYSESSTLRALLKLDHFPFQGEWYVYNPRELRNNPRLPGEPYTGCSWHILTLDEIDSVSYCSDLERAKLPDDQDDAHLFFMPNYMGGSDYSGDAVTRTNATEFTTLCAKENVRCYDVNGDFGTYGIALHADTLLTDAILDCLAGLKEYPSINDEALSEHEMKLQNEAWESDYRKDFIRAIEKDLEVDIDDDQNAAIDDLFHTMMETTNTYWIIETGESVYIDLKRIVEPIELDTLGEHNVTYSPMYGPDCPQCNLGTLSLPGEYAQGIEICNTCRQEFCRDSDGILQPTKHFTA